MCREDNRVFVTRGFDWVGWRGKILSGEVYCFAVVRLGIGCGEWVLSWTEKSYWSFSMA